MDPLKVLVFGSIATAEDFENDDLFVHYFFRLEDGWTTSGPLFGVTHCSRTRCNRRVEVAHFSHPFELELDRPTSGDDQEGAAVGQLFLEVLSLDSWSRLRLEGYAYCDLLAVPGGARRMAGLAGPGRGGVRWLAGFRAHFISLVGDEGERPQRCKRLSRYALQTESSGTVKVLLNVVRQTTYKARETEIARRVLGSIGRQVSQSSIAAVLASFHRARSRMLAARARHAALSEV